MSRLIPDRATIELGLGAVPEAVTRALASKQGLGVHSGAVGDGIANLMTAGVVDNLHKEIDPGVAVATDAHRNRVVGREISPQPSTRGSALFVAHRVSWLRAPDNAGYRWLLPVDAWPPRAAC
jgi:hypothetical protein